MLQQVFPFAFLIVWIGGTIPLTRVLLRKQGAYLEGFRPIDRFKAMWWRQDDPASEGRRREVWRWYGYALLWELGVPLVTVGALKLVQ